MHRRSEGPGGFPHYSPNNIAHIENDIKRIYLGLVPIIFISQSIYTHNSNFKLIMDFKEIDLNKIDIKYNVRKDEIDKEKIHELAENIKENSLLQPIVVWPRGDRFELIIGQRRYLAFKELGYSSIPAKIEHFDDEIEATLASFSENMLREELSYRDKNRVALELKAKFGDINVVARKLGITLQTATKYLGYSTVPEEIKDLVDQRKIGANLALRISGNIADKQKAISVAKLIIDEPGNENRQKIIETARDNPNVSIEKIAALAKKRKRKITINPSDIVFEALIKASDSYQYSKEDITLEALEEWLKSRGFIHE